MRCYLMKGGRIAAVELLDAPLDDTAAIDQAGTVYVNRRHEGFEGFEVWERARLVYRFPDSDWLDRHGSGGSKNGGAPPGQNGKKTAEIGISL